jgi:uncharacterized Rossmann fold enzyme
MAKTGTSTPLYRGRLASSRTTQNQKSENKQQEKVQRNETKSQKTNWAKRLVHTQVSQTHQTKLKQAISKIIGSCRVCPVTNVTNKNALLDLTSKFQKLNKLAQLKTLQEKAAAPHQVSALP